MIRRFKGWHEALLAVILAALLFAAGRIDPVFVSVDTQVELASHIWEMAILALPMTLIIVTAGIDLSVGSALALCAVALGMAYERGVSPYVGVGIAVALGAGLGSLNGWFVSRLRVNPLIVTLATLAAFRGVAEGVSLARPVSNFPEGFAWLGRGSIGPLPVAGCAFAVLALAAWVALTRTAFGRSLYAIGHNELATRFSGINVARIKLLLYTLSGAAAGLAAAIMVSRRNTAKADLGNGLEMDVITAVVLGGASTNGGKGTIFGTLLGLALIHETREFVSWKWERDELNLIVVGAMLVLSVLAQSLFNRSSRESA